MWTLVHCNEMEVGNRILKDKWVYKVKQDIKERVVRFKAR